MTALSDELRQNVDKIAAHQFAYAKYDEVILSEPMSKAFFDLPADRRVMIADTVEGLESYVIVFRSNRGEILRQIVAESAIKGMAE